VKRILIVYNTAYYVYNFRRPLIRRLSSLGYEVHVAAPRDDYAPRLIAEEGIIFHHTPLDGKGLRPLRDISYCLGLIKLYGRVRPQAVLQYTIKPNIYGSIAASIVGIPAIDNVTGLGAAFAKDSILQRFVRVLYKLAFSRVERVFFQNPDDQALFLRHRLVSQDACGLLPGSGVDTGRFSPRPRNGSREGFTFLLAARLLAEKGVADYANAARIVKARRPEAHFLLAGDHDPVDTHMIPRSDLDGWLREGLIEWLGRVEDIRDAIARADCIVLPSRYREGVPRSLLEAASMAKPLIASDSVGTREPVVEGVNGFLCRPGDPEDLARAMLGMAGLDEDRRAAMGAASRKKMQDEFEETLVLDAYQTALRELES
jgi:glycosyltransferase involved in cell wall biosynthesis